MLVHTLNIFQTTTTSSPEVRQVYTALTDIMGEDTGRIISALRKYQADTLTCFPRLPLS
jgi:hypothetical protein